MAGLLLLLETEVEALALAHRFAEQQADQDADDPADRHAVDRARRAASCHPGRTGLGHRSCSAGCRCRRSLVVITHGCYPFLVVVRARREFICGVECRESIVPGW